MGSVYEIPILTVVEFAPEDVITTSGLNKGDSTTDEKENTLNGLPWF